MPASPKPTTTMSAPRAPAADHCHDPLAVLFGVADCVETYRSGSPATGVTTRDMGRSACVATKE